MYLVGYESDAMERPTPDTMTAVVQDQYGTVAAEVLGIEQIDRPTIKAGEVLVARCATSLDRGTWHLMAGLPWSGDLRSACVRPDRGARSLDVAGVGRGAIGKGRPPRFQPG